MLRRRRSSGVMERLRRGSRAACLTVLLCLLVVVPAGWVAGHAAFVATTTGNTSLAAANGSFPTYPQAVLNDSPLFYYRFEDAAGSVTALDSSGNNRRGVFAPQATAFGTTEGATWPLDENSGAVSADLSGAATPNDLSLNGPSWTSGRYGSALSFNGTSHYAASATAAVNTSTDFSISVWVYLHDTATSHTAVSQAGGAVSGFELGYDSSLAAWVFRMPQSDSAAAPVDVTSGGTVVADTWTYLVATLTGTTMTLYVDYNRVGTQPTHSSLWNATGPLEVGAGLTTTRTRFWNGRIDDVRTYTSSMAVNSDLLGTEGQPLAFGITGGPATAWQFNENAGTTAADLSGATNYATLVNGATWGTGANKKWSTSAGSFDGVDDYAAGRFAAITTNAAFSVAAWVKLTDTSVSRIAVSQDGNSASGFALGYDKASNAWSFEMARTDVAAPVFDRAVAGGAPTTGSWVHLVGVYDPASTGSEVKLYVGGALAGSAARSAAWSSTGTAIAGAAKDVSKARFWKGYLDDVRFFGMGLRPADVSRLATDDPGSGYIFGRGTLGVAGALQGSEQGQRASTAYANSKMRAVYNPLVLNNPTTFTLECWYRTSAANLGRALASFGNAPEGNTSGGGNRRLFIDANGNFGYGQSPSTTFSTSGVNYVDGAWHYVAVTVSPTAGIVLYIDGHQAATRSYTAATNMSGYWRMNGDTWGGGTNWVSPTTTDYNEVSTVDEFAVYSTALNSQQIAWHYYANH